MAFTRDATLSEDHILLALLAEVEVPTKLSAEEMNAKVAAETASKSA